MSVLLHAQQGLGCGPETAASGAVYLLVNEYTPPSCFAEDAEHQSHSLSAVSSPGLISHHQVGSVHPHVHRASYLGLCCCEGSRGGLLCGQGGCCLCLAQCCWSSSACPNATLGEEQNVESKISCGLIAAEVTG